MEGAEASLVRHTAQAGMHIVGSMGPVGSCRADRAVDLENHMAYDLEAEGMDMGMDMDMDIGLAVVGIGLPEEDGLMWVLPEVRMSRNPM